MRDVLVSVTRRKLSVDRDVTRVSQWTVGVHWELQRRGERWYREGLGRSCTSHVLSAAFSNFPFSSFPLTVLRLYERLISRS
jgi:hypothetical protein